ncbi:TetR/AcrR family transcriptional regulator [Yinghuangia seranimata]|uniref:TetR/AcrR family transcriptional regulator n=1 Tax=Yinghuangia seranimata TaxID=408067 RepID=UPI00248AF2D3|nr:TetR/AcrR family transcriptional regulator [Yinghuangia seranimata]MDI2126490.1 TetR/AcrR family transcriptional regulator [Yinghuangia seranimata]
MASAKTGRSDPARTLALLWRGKEPAARGPKPGLGVDRIVAAAVELADEEGLAAVSMRKVAERLGVGAMSLYTYVPGKDELLNLMVDAVLAEADRPADFTGTWREGLELHARADRAVALRHPWLVGLSTPGLMLMGPGETARAEFAMRAVSDIGLTPREMADVVNMVDGYVRGVAQISADIGATNRETDVGYEDWWAQATPMLERFIQQSRYPALYGVWAAGAFETPPEEGFEFGLQRVLDGIEAWIDGRTAVPG